MFKLSKRSGIIFKMAICLSQHNTCLNTEYSSRRKSREKIESSEWLLQRQNFSGGFLTSKFSKNRYICFSHRPRTHTIYSLKSRSLESGEGCMIKDWNMDLPYAFPSSSMISRVFLKTGMGSSLDSDCTSFRYANMLPRALKLPSSRNRSCCHRKRKL